MERHLTAHRFEYLKGTKELVWRKGVQKNKSEKVLIAGWLMVLLLYSAGINISVTSKV